MTSGRSAAAGEAVLRVRRALRAGGFADHIIELDGSARSAAEAAAAIGCEVAQIAKSIIFRGHASDRPILVIASGANRVREAALQPLLGEMPGKADADYVRARTGFVIGGVAPLAHLEAPRVLIDSALLGFEYVWAAAGHPRVVLRLDPRELQAMAGGTVADIS